ncbi:MAG: hypothetical protein HOV87_11720 [Catenulispora sp.]|nr:hypothetical protein [Catenulispora sp.]
MSKFAERLYQDLMEDFGHTLQPMPPRGKQPSRSRQASWMLATAVIAVAAGRRRVRPERPEDVRHRGAD